MSDPHHPNPRRKFGLESGLEAVGERRDASAMPADAHTHAHTHTHAHSDGAESTDHLASIYERRAEQFAAVVPFIRQGLERGERCLYVADDNSRDDVLDALREGGIDVDAALESGALSIHTKADTYLRTGEFDRETMLEFWREQLADARTDEYAGVRAAAEMTWALDEDLDLERLVAYEALLNDLYDGDDYAVLCQYDRERFPADVLSDVIRTHPLVVADGTVCQNFYYHSPDEFFGADHPPVDVDRTVEGLVSRARTRRALAESDRDLRRRLRQQEVVAELSRQGLEGRDLDELLAVVAERIADILEPASCAVLELRPDGETLRVREGAGGTDGAESADEVTVAADGDSLVGADEPVIVSDLDGTSRVDASALAADRDASGAIGVGIGSSDDRWGALCVYARDERSLSEHDATFVRTLADTVATAIDRTERERYQRDLYEITSSPDESFESKLQAVFELGCERFDLELGGLARIDPRTDLFEVEYVSDDHEHLEPGARVALSETYCRVHATDEGEERTEDGTPTGITDPDGAGFADSAAYEAFGVRSYLGTRIRLENDLDRTFFFVSSEPRDAAFTADDRTFLSLMGQWLQHELERRQYERRLEESNERLEQFAYAASHDLQEPLRMVSSYLQLLEQRYADDLDADGEEFIDFAVDGAERMREMIDALLKYSRVDKGEASFGPVDLEDVLDDVRGDLRMRIEEHDAEIAADSLPTVYGDEEQLRHVFQNLLDNAIEYSGAAPPRVDVSAERRGDEWRIAVRDDGIGIDRDDQDRIFDVFERLHALDEHEGTGIGLALCERIVERHGGDIWVESELGEGSTFYFTLPLEPQPAEGTAGSRIAGRNPNRHIG